MIKIGFDEPIVVVAINCTLFSVVKPSWPSVTYATKEGEAGLLTFVINTPLECADIAYVEPSIDGMWYNKGGGITT